MDGKRSVERLPDWYLLLNNLSFLDSHLNLWNSFPTTPKVFPQV